LGGDLRKKNGRERAKLGQMGQALSAMANYAGKNSKIGGPEKAWLGGWGGDSNTRNGGVGRMTASLATEKGHGEMAADEI